MDNDEFNEALGYMIGIVGIPLLNLIIALLEGASK
jgi:hypothetical protein